MWRKSIKQKGCNWQLVTKVNRIYYQLISSFKLYRCTISIEMWCHLCTIICPSTKLECILELYVKSNQCCCFFMIAYFLFTFQWNQSLRLPWTAIHTYFTLSDHYKLNTLIDADSCLYYLFFFASFKFRYILDTTVHWFTINTHVLKHL